MKFGDKVTYQIDGDRGGGYVIGWHLGTNYIAMIANEQYHGMPINVGWLETSGESDIESAEKWRTRYLQNYPRVKLPRSARQ